MANSSICSIRYKDISDDKVDIAVTKFKFHVTLIRNRQLTSRSRNTASLSSARTMKRSASRCASATKILRSWQLHRQGQILEQAEQFEHDYDKHRRPWHGHAVEHAVRAGHRPPCLADQGGDRQHRDLEAAPEAARASLTSARAGSAFRGSPGTILPSACN